MATASPSAASQILNERLLARRHDARKARRQTDFGPSTMTDDEDAAFTTPQPYPRSTRLDTAAANSHFAPMQSITTPTRTATQPTQAPGTVGLKEMDAKLSALEKLNFDLKMEVYHRREREDKLIEQIRTMTGQLLLAEKMREEHTALLAMNQELSKDLGMANEAVDQAASMICDLEAETEQLQADNASLRQKVKESMDRRDMSGGSDSGYSGSLGQDTSAIHRKNGSSRYPPDIKGTNTGRHTISRGRVPSFMSDLGNEKTSALRETYGNQPKSIKEAQSFVSMFSAANIRDEHDRDFCGSPRLSILSESSFLTFAGLKPALDADERKMRPQNDVSAASAPLSPLKSPTRQSTAPTYHEDSISRVSEWISSDGDLSRPAMFLTYSNPGSPSRHRDSHQDLPSPIEHERKFFGSAVDLTRDEDPRTPLYDDFPDGNSISTGTPRRFRVKEIPAQAQRPSSQLSSPTRTQFSSQHRRNSSAEIRPRLITDSLPPADYAHSSTSPRSPVILPQIITTLGTPLQSTSSPTATTQPTSSAPHHRPSLTTDTQPTTQSSQRGRPTFPPLSTASATAKHSRSRSLLSSSVRSPADSDRQEGYSLSHPSPWPSMSSSPFALPSRRTSTRASIAAKTHRFLDRLGVGPSAAGQGGYVSPSVLALVAPGGAAEQARGPYVPPFAAGRTAAVAAGRSNGRQPQSQAQEQGQMQKAHTMHALTARSGTGAVPVDPASMVEDEERTGGVEGNIYEPQREVRPSRRRRSSFGAAVTLGGH